MSEKQKTHLANSIEVADVKSKMDENAKQLLANKQVLSWIFKHTVKEFGDYTYEEIEGCIEGEPEIGAHPVHPGKGNVEAQKSYYLTYPWILRGLFYCARMVSEQKDTEFRHDDYSDLKTVYSIWIFMESPKYAAHTISSYTVEHNNLYGEYVEKERYDLMNVIAVRLAVNENLGGGSELHQMLETLFSSSMTVQEKEEKLEKEFGMRMTEAVREGANSMCNYSDFVEEQGVKKGITKGETRLGTLITILLKDGLTDVVELVAVDEKVRAEYYKKYNIE